MRGADVFGVPFRMPAAHPMRTVRALRVLLALPRPCWPAAIPSLYAAYWEHTRDITQDAVIAATLEEDAGLPAAEVAAALARADDPAIHDELRLRTDEALALGVFGAPAWIVRRPQALMPTRQLTRRPMPRAFRFTNRSAARKPICFRSR